MDNEIYGIAMGMFSSDPKLLKIHFFWKGKRISVTSNGTYEKIERDVNGSRI